MSTCLDQVVLWWFEIGHRHMRALQKDRVGEGAAYSTATSADQDIFSLNRKTDGAHSNFLAPETNEQIHNDRFFRIREAIFDFETYGFPLEDSGQATFGA
jgi:hypothetical protein